MELTFSVFGLWGLGTLHPTPPKPKKPYRHPCESAASPNKAPQTLVESLQETFVKPNPPRCGALRRAGPDGGCGLPAGDA